MDGPQSLRGGPRGGSPCSLGPDPFFLASGRDIPGPHGVRPVPGVHSGEPGEAAVLALHVLGLWRRWTWTPLAYVTLGNLGAWATLAILGAYRPRSDGRPVLGASLGNLGAVATLAILGSLGRWCWAATPLPTSLTLGNLGAVAALAILGALVRQVDMRPELGASLGNLGAVATLAILGSLGRWCWAATPLPTSLTLGNLGAVAALAILGALLRQADRRPELGASLGNLGALATLAILGSFGR